MHPTYAILLKAAVRASLALLEAKRLRSSETAVMCQNYLIEYRHRLQARGELARKTKARRSK